LKRLKMVSKDLGRANIEKLGELFPNVITEIEDEEGNLIKAVDMDLLKQELSYQIVEGEKERYQLAWPGKREAMQLAGMPTSKTLRPLREESVDWETTGNLYIEGDNLEVLKILQESYLNSVKCIYIDPPYNTGKDFIYKDNFRQDKDNYLALSGQVDSDGNRLFQNTESNGRFHSDWLSMMYPRLKLAKNLLSQDGVIFISIGDSELANIRKLCEESGLFGGDNYRNMLIVRRYDKNLNRQFMKNGLPSLNVGVEYVLVYTKNIQTRLQPVFKQASVKRSRTGYWKGFWNNADRPTMRYELFGFTPESGQWKWKRELAEEAVKNYEEYRARYSSELTLEDYWAKTGKVKRFIRRSKSRKGKNMGVEHWIPPSDGILRNSNWSDIFASKDAGLDIPFDNPKNFEMIMELCRLCGVSDHDIVMDFFSGSATTAHAVMRLNAEDGGNRKYIMVQLPEPCPKNSHAYNAGFRNISDIGKERIRRAAKNIKEETGAEIDYGFRVFRVDTSNMKDFYYHPEKLTQQQIAATISNIKDDRTPDDLLFQVMLQWGLKLSLPMAKRNILGKNIHFVAGNSLVACFDEDISEDLIREIARGRPQRVVFRDSSFSSDASRINAKEIFKGVSPVTEINVF
jgi:adenine-specific DNA-methyltransferase